MESKDSEIIRNEDANMCRQQHTRSGWLCGLSLDAPEYKMNFLTAEWNHLLFANYSIEAEVLKPFIPAGTKIDTINGQTFVSLVAFMFNKTRILGLPIPFHRNFEEVNLRFYVTPINDDTKRSVTFIKEIVPLSAIPLIANNLFNENYIAMKMSHSNTAGYHEYTFMDKTKCMISGKITNELKYPTKGSVDKFIGSSGFSV